MMAAEITCMGYILLLGEHSRLGVRPECSLKSNQSNDLFGMACEK